MLCRVVICLCTVLMCWTPVRALEPNEVVVIANADFPPSVRLARYYCRQRGLPSGYVIPVRLGTALRDSISRDEYDKRLARPIRRIFSRSDFGSVCRKRTKPSPPLKRPIRLSAGSGCAKSPN